MWLVCAKGLPAVCPGRSFRLVLYVEYVYSLLSIAITYFSCFDCSIGLLLVGIAVFLSVCTCFFFLHHLPLLFPLHGAYVFVSPLECADGPKLHGIKFSGHGSRWRCAEDAFRPPSEPYSLDPSRRTATTLTFSTRPRRLHTLSRYPHTCSSWCEECRLGQPLHCILVRRYVHDGHARHLA